MTPRPRLAPTVILCLLAALALGATLVPSRSRNYEVLSDLRPFDQRALTTHMDAVFDEYSRRFASFDVKTDTPVRLYLFQNRKDYEKVLTGKGVDPSNTAGMFFASNGPAGAEAGLAAWVGGNDHQRLLHTLQHEGFHQFAFLRIARNLPIWLNEGLAEYFGEGLLIGERFELGLVPDDRLARLKLAIRKQEFFPFSQMLDMPHEEWNARVAGDDKRSTLQYDEAWGMVQYLVHGDRGKYAPAFERYIRLISSGAPSRLAFGQAFDTVDPAAFEQAWTRYILQLEPDPVSTAVERLQFLGEGLKALFQRRERPATIEALKAALQRGNFRVTITDHTMKRTLEASDNRLFMPPFDKGKTTRLELVPNHDASLPSELRVTGLRATVILTWTRTPNGEPDAEIMFR